MRFVSIVSLALLSTVAHAQPNAAQGEALFHQGKELLAKGKIAEACAAFDASQKLAPSVSTVFRQAECREQLGQLATALGLLQEAARLTRTAQDASLRALYDKVIERSRKLEPRLSTLTVTIPEGSQIGGLEILLGTDVLDQGAWNKTLPIDGGTYRITARAPGNAEWTTTVIVGVERDSKIVDIPRLKSAELQQAPIVEPPPRVVAPTPVVQPPTVEPPPPVAHRSRRWMIAGGGAVALLGGALALELVAEAKYDDAKSNLDPDTQLSLWRSANRQRYVATGLGVAGLATAGVAVWLYVRNRREQRMAVAPMTTNVGIQLVGGF